MLATATSRQHAAGIELRQQHQRQRQWQAVSMLQSGAHSLVKQIKALAKCRPDSWRSFEANPCQLTSLSLAAVE